jgi:hypothetical protein
MIATMGLIPVDQVVTVRGIAISKAATILVQPLETAIVRSIDVREGQQVKAGEVLAKLDPTFAAADLGALTAQVSSLEAEVSRLQAEAENKPFDYTGLDPDLALQGAIYAHRRAEFTAKGWRGMRANSTSSPRSSRARNPMPRGTATGSGWRKPSSRCARSSNRARLAASSILRRRWTAAPRWREQWPMRSRPQRAPGAISRQ